MGRVPVFPMEKAASLLTPHGVLGEHTSTGNLYFAGGIQIFPALSPPPWSGGGTHLLGMFAVHPEPAFSHPFADSDVSA